MFFKNTRALFGLLACFVMIMMINFLDSIVAVRFEKNFGLSEDVVGYVFACPFLIYAIGCPFVTAISNRLHRRITITIAFVLGLGGIIMTGPSLLLQLPE
jgi:MFS family permease